MSLRDEKCVCRERKAWWRGKKDKVVLGRGRTKESRAALCRPCWRFVFGLILQQFRRFGGRELYPGGVGLAHADWDVAAGTCCAERAAFPFPSPPAASMQELSMATKTPAPSFGASVLRRSSFAVLPRGRNLLPAHASGHLSPMPPSIGTPGYHACCRHASSRPVAETPPPSLPGPSFRVAVKHQRRRRSRAPVGHRLRHLICTHARIAHLVLFYTRNSCQLLSGALCATPITYSCCDTPTITASAFVSCWSRISPDRCPATA